MGHVESRVNQQGPPCKAKYSWVTDSEMHNGAIIWNGRRNTNIKLDWRKRSAICTGTAKGLVYLHEELAPHVMHKDIKASTVLLDKDLILK
ncbi:hypothetical protein RJT34_14169 [Clitoria ternatea]|uniref:Protein kinase domain-containing protein n=1 Tax=Clitoria ternatea TaxID=43366 RepID=A0AAN9JQ69_CLITE